MRQSVVVVLLVALVLLAGCQDHVQPDPPTDRTTETPHPTPNCDAFGTGGVFSVMETNTTVTSVEEAQTVVTAAQQNESVDIDNETAYSHVPRDKIDETDDVRDRLREVPANTTLYYFSEGDSTDIHEMLIVADTGQLYIAIVGAC